jgi:hypothetical protein
MKYLVSALVCFIAASAFVINTKVEPIAIGTIMPLNTTKLNNVVSGASVDLKSLKGKNGTLVIFSCNTCPFVIANQNRFKAIQKMGVGYNIGVAIINSNEGKRSSDDSEANMKNYAAQQEYSAAYLNDINNVFADAFGATVTPECFLFDANDRLVYHGAIDDSPRDADAVKTTYLADAMLNLNQKLPIITDNTKGIGCSIKRKK